jgi:lipoprotein-anchoring transpeptidase ErfK/SrfK
MATIAATSSASCHRGLTMNAKLARSVDSGMMRAMKSLILLAMLAVLAPHANAEPAKKKYHFELTRVLAKENVKPDVAKIAQARIEAQVKKAFETHPQLVANMDGAPDPAADNGQPYRRFLEKKGLSGAYLVTVEITDASEEVVPLEDKKSQRIVVKVGIHVLGETIPGRTMGFTGDGQATVKLEVGKTVRDKDRDYTWDGAAETAINDALKTCFAQLAKGAPKQHN